MTDDARWCCRGYLPHFDAADILITLTFRLEDAIPQEKAIEFERLGQRSGEAARRKAIEACLDEGYGHCWLVDDRIATLVENALLFFHRERYKLHEWAVMPTHVHSIFERWPGWPLRTIAHS